MEKGSKELTKVKKMGVFERIKSFFVCLFKGNKKKIEKNNKENIEEVIVPKPSEINVESDFRNGLRENVNEIQQTNENVEEAKRLQKLFHNGEIKETDLTAEQYDMLDKWYDEEIKKLEIRIEANKQKLAELKAN